MAKPAENLDARFDRFLRTRDGAELAAVFDGTAPELHRLALHLAGSAAEAEDLVQETYIHLLHHLDDYRSEGKFMGWLLAILATKSLQARNRRRHRDLAGQEPVDPAPSPTEAWSVSTCRNSSRREPSPGACGATPAPCAASCAGDWTCCGDPCRRPWPRPWWRCPGRP